MKFFWLHMVKVLLLVVFVGLTLPFSSVQAVSTGSEVDVFTMECNDGIDNDADTFVDFPADPGCSSLTDTTENSDTYDCSDGIDNDGDLLIDFPADPGCSGPSDSSEINSSGGSTSSGGGSGGGRPRADLIVTGIAQPNATVLLLDRGVEIDRINADSDAYFRFDTNMDEGSHIFSFYSIDSDSLRSNTVTIPTVLDDDTNRLDGIFIPPTIQIRTQATLIEFIGQTKPAAQVTLDLAQGSAALIAPVVISDSNGYYQYTKEREFFTEDVVYSAKAKAFISSGTQSGFGRLVNFDLEGATVVAGSCSDNKADLNSDGKVNLVDFSIAAYWWKKVLSAEFMPIEECKLNGDQKVNLVDFSIIAYHWTG